MKVFITGLCGTLGSSVARLHHERGDTVFGCSRSESKIVEWLRLNPGVAKVYSCDTLNLDNPKLEVTQALLSSDRCYHLAALKHVDLCQRQPDEALFQNVYRTTIIGDVCEKEGIPLVFVSSDKACLPESVYGCTKYLAEVEVLRRGGAVVRLGNLIGSSGSVFQIWKDCLKKKQPIHLTDPEMTRYFIPVESAAYFLINQYELGKIIAPSYMKSISMGSVANLLISYWKGSSSDIKVVGPRPGETTHQYLFAPGNRVQLGNSKYILSQDGPIWEHGISSFRAERRWDIEELLKVAGVV